MKFPYTVTAASITVFVGGQIIQLPSTHIGFKALAEHLQGKTHDAATIKQLADKREALARLTAGQVTVIGSTVYYKGVPVRSELSNRLVELTDQGFDATPWALFMDKVMQNPSENSRERLFAFLDRWHAPLTPDGNFVAFKGVREDYSSTRKRPDGTPVYNRPGDVVEMPRDEVVEDPNITCASGLHACASHYLDSFWSTQNKVLALEIDPADVVSIPTDYNLSKMRVCRYTVIGDVEDTRHRDRIEKAQIVDTNENGRVTPIQPTPLVLTQDQRADTDKEFFTYEGQTYETWDEDFDEGDVVVCNETGLTGKVLERGEISYREDDHPLHDEWLNGDLAGSDIRDAQFAVVAFEDGTEKFLTWEDSDLWPCDRLELVEQAEDEDEGEDEAENLLVFTHDSGREFSAPDLIKIVSELGQRGFARKFGIPRTTVQDWLRRAAESGY